MATKAELVKMLETALTLKRKAMPLVYEKSLKCLEMVKNSEMIEADKILMRRLLFKLMSGVREEELGLKAFIKKVEESEKSEF